MKNLILLLSFFAFYSMNGQGVIKGVILDEQGDPAPYANLMLLDAENDELIKGEFSSESGSFEFANLNQNQFKLQISYVGYDLFTSEIISLVGNTLKDLGEIRLKLQGAHIEGVEVKATRPLLELKSDKMVFNVDGSVNAVGSNGLELLRKSPGVVVDNNESINVMGKSGTKVFVNGKEVPFSGQDLADYLKSLNSNEIDNIEIITNPSAKYDAEGNAGIINIRLKKAKGHGANASINLGMAQGKTSRYSGGISGNYRNGAMNTFGSYNYNDGAWWNEQNFYREQNGYVFDQVSDQTHDYQGHNYKLGTDFFINDKHTVGFLINGNINMGNGVSDSRAEIGMAGSNTVDSLLIGQAIRERKRMNNNFNINYRFDNKAGKSLNIDADYGLFNLEGSSLQPNYYTSADGQTILSEKIYESITPIDIKILTFKADYSQALWKGNLDIGIKSAYILTENVFDFYNVFGTEKVKDLDRSNNFNYTENVNAAYANYAAQLNGKIGFNAGLRLEHSHTIGDLESQNPTPEDYVEQDYLDVFPSAGISYKMNDKNTFQLSYSKRINRPNYQDLNPFEYKLDELTFSKGNPFLNPEYANKVQLTHSWAYKLNTTIAYSNTTNMIARLTGTADEKGAFITWLNLAKQDHYSINFSAPIPIQDWWSSYTSVTGYHVRNEADFGDGVIIDANATSFNIYSQHSFRLPKDLSIELSGWYNSPSLWEGSFQMEDMYSIDLGVQKRLLQNRATVKLSVSDIFLSSGWKGYSDFGGLYMRANGLNDSRRVKLDFSYTLGNQQVKANRRKAGSVDEASRVKSDG